MMASVVANGNRDGQSLVLKGVDPETCMIVFKNHWAQVKHQHQANSLRTVKSPASLVFHTRSKELLARFS